MQLRASWYSDFTSSGTLFTGFPNAAPGVCLPPSKNVGLIQPGQTTISQSAWPWNLYPLLLPVDRPQCPHVQLLGCTPAMCGQCVMSIVVLLGGQRLPG